MVRRGPPRSAAAGRFVLVLGDALFVSKVIDDCMKKEQSTCFYYPVLQVPGCRKSSAGTVRRASGLPGKRVRPCRLLSLRIMGEVRRCWFLGKKHEVLDLRRRQRLVE